MAVQHGSYWTSCDCKVAYGCYKQAKAAKNRLRRLYGVRTLVIYRCWWCGWLHLGNRTSRPWEVEELEVVA